MKIYSSILSTTAIDQFAKFTLKQSSRTSTLVLRVLIDIVRNQGDSPANIIERTTGDRGHSGAEKMIALLVEWNYISLVELAGKDRVGKTARRLAYITPAGAKRLGLNKHKNSAC